jgi:tRNA A37 N6-isopentenylltransferase MiaA
MSMHLDRMIATARERSVDDVWDLERSERVRTGVVRRRDVRARRDRVLRRGLLVAGGAGLLVLALLRGASSAPAEPQLAAATATATAATAATPATAPTAEALAARSLSDAGYARD